MAGTEAGTTVAGGWSRQRLLAILVCAGVVAVVVLVGFVYAVFLALHSAGTRRWVGDPPTLSRQRMTSSSSLGGKHRDEVAAQPMLQVDEDAMKPTTPTTQLADSIVIPSSRATRADDVRSGFPHTAAGAIGQLAELSQTVLTSMSVTIAHRVYDDWAMPGGVGADQWRMTANVTSFLGAAGMGTTRSPGATVSVIPAAAQIKGTDGPDWTVACVLFEVDATINSHSSIGYGYCERMQWQTETGEPVGGRWMLAPGTPAVAAPNTWPGSALALRAGWLTWITHSQAGRADKAAANAPDNPAGDGPGTSGHAVEPEKENQP
jgi:hypothetical protein